MYYSKSKRKWMDESEMNHVHLLNAYELGIREGVTQEALRAEILKRMGEPIVVTVGGRTITITPSN